MQPIALTILALAGVALGSCSSSVATPSSATPTPTQPICHGAGGSCETGDGVECCPDHACVHNICGVIASPLPSCGNLGWVCDWGAATPSTCCGDLECIQNLCATAVPLR